MLERVAIAALLRPTAAAIAEQPLRLAVDPRGTVFTTEVETRKRAAVPEGAQR